MPSLDVHLALNRIEASVLSPAAQLARRASGTCRTNASKPLGGLSTGTNVGCSTLALVGATEEGTELEPRLPATVGGNSDGPMLLKIGEGFGPRFRKTSSASTTRTTAAPRPSQIVVLERPELTGWGGM